MLRCPCCCLLQNFFPTIWPHAAEQEGMPVKVVPTLTVMALHRRAMPTTILAGMTCCCCGDVQERKGVRSGSGLHAKLAHTLSAGDV